MCLLEGSYSLMVFFISLPVESFRNPTGNESHRKTEVF